MSVNKYIDCAFIISDNYFDNIIHSIQNPSSLRMRFARTIFNKHFLYIEIDCRIMGSILTTTSIQLRHLSAAAEANSAEIRSVQEVSTLSPQKHIFLFFWEVNSFLN